MFEARRLKPLAVLPFLLLSVAAPAQEAARVQDNVTPPPGLAEIRLKTSSPPLTTTPQAWVRVGDAYLVHNVGEPTLTPFLPPEGKANGTAIIIAPGGAFKALSMSKEGWDVARWLASKGITAFVLKYRLTPSASTFAGMMAGAALLKGNAYLSSDWFAAGTRIATEDAMEAMRTVRGGAVKWKIDPRKVGFMGFSAGAYTTLGLVDHATPDTMPDFVAPIYGPLGTPTSALPAKLPPMWAAIASDDPLLGRSDLGLIPAWQARDASVEFHLYDRGGHGFGFAGTPGTTTVNWPGHFLAWLQTRGLYTPPPPK